MILIVGRGSSVKPLLFFVGINFAMGVLNLALGIATLT